MNEYYRSLNCNLTQIGGLLDTKGYGIGMPLGEHASQTFCTTSGHSSCLEPTHLTVDTSDITAAETEPQSRPEVVVFVLQPLPTLTPGFLKVWSVWKILSVPRSTSDDLSRVSAESGLGSDSHQHLSVSWRPSRQPASREVMEAQPEKSPKLLLDLQTPQKDCVLFRHPAP